ncbi:hypothetical protein CKO09_09400 [Chromatium weissei]|nr:hypothetical protein [Chromatium weissei]
MLVKYELEDDIPIDESSENLRSTYAPTDFIEWAVEKKSLSEIKIKESAGETADVPISIINDSEDRCLESILQYVETKLIRCIEDTYSHISESVILPKELDNDFSVLDIWLEVRKVIKEKKEKYRNNYNIKLVIG